MMMSQSSQNESMPDAVGFVSLNTQPAKIRDNQPICAVTVKQIVQANSSPDANFLIDGVNVNNVKLVGMVYDISERKSDVSFVIDDGTGRVACKRWVNDAHDTKEVGYLKNEVYVRVHGQLKRSQAKTQLVVYAIRPVTDKNEITSHFLECIHSHCHNAKLQIQSNVFAPKSATMVVNTPVGSRAISPSQVYKTEGQFTTAVNTPVESQAISSTLVINTEGLEDLDKLILGYLQQPSSSEQRNGVHVKEIAQKLGLPQTKIMDALRSLQDEGLAYSTIDEFHYAAVV